MWKVYNYECDNYVIHILYKFLMAEVCHKESA